MRIDMSPILCGETNETSFEYRLVPASDFDFSGIAFNEPLHVSGKVTNNAGYMTLSVSASGIVSSFCARCLAPVLRELEFSFTKPVVQKGSLESDESDDYLFIENGMLDADTPVCEEIILSMPSRFFCKEDCLGLCPVCGTDLNVGKCSCVTKETDPRLEILKSIRFDEETK